MTVAELIEELEEYDKGAEVLIKVSNSMYVDSIRNVREDEVRAFFGKDFSSVILVGDEQIGAV